MRRPPFGTAHAEVLVKLARRGKSWSPQNGAALYENRLLTNAICQGLVLQGLLSEEFDGITPTYTVTREGHNKAKQLRNGR